MKAQDLKDMLRRKYTPKTVQWETRDIVRRGFACFEEFQFGGKHGRKRIDFVSVGLWASNGFTRRAFEVKVSRSDFLSEIKNLEKSWEAREFFHEFWIVAPKGLFDVSELSEGAGWMYPTKRGLRIGHQATYNPAPTNSDGLIAMFCQYVQKQNIRAENKAAEGG